MHQWPRWDSPETSRILFADQNSTKFLEQQRFQEPASRMHPDEKSAARDQPLAALLTSPNHLLPFWPPPTTQVTAQVTGYTHQIQDSVICQTKNCIYYWKCNKNKCKDFPRDVYVGCTTGPFRIWLGEHKQYVRSENVDKPSGYHFNQPGQNQSHLSGLSWKKWEVQIPLSSKLESSTSYNNLTLLTQQRTLSVAELRLRRFN